MAVIYDPLGNVVGSDAPESDIREAQSTLDAPSTSAPPKANSAPTPTGKNTFTGLCEALNAFQQKLVKDRIYRVADQYQIQFAPPTIAQAKLKKPGTTNQSATAMQQPTTAKTAKDPATNSVATTSRTQAITAGMQIIQFIDQVIRGSTYISDQQKVVIDETTGKTKPNANNTDGQVAWYKISIQAEQLAWDDLRNDFAYRMTFLVTPYGINEAPSEYFPKTSFRGIHKSYNYWFTGQNTEIIDYSQVINNLYNLTMSDSLATNNSAETNPQNLYRRSWSTRSQQSDQGAKGKTLEAAANLADALYNQSDFINTKLKIVGDPAWIPQGEVSGGLSVSTFSFAPFLNDGTINVDASEPVFSVTFQQPSDYDFKTGLINNKGTQNQQLQPVSMTYKAIKCVSHFNRGRFEQDLEGTLLTTISKEPGREAGRPAVTADTTARQPAQPTFANTAGGAALGNPRLTRQGLRAGATQLNPETNPAAAAPSDPPLTNMPPARAPTSNGGVSGATILNGAPPAAITILPATPTLNPNATGQTLVAQKMIRDD